MERMYMQIHFDHNAVSMAKVRFVLAGDNLVAEFVLVPMIFTETLAEVEHKITLWLNQKKSPEDRAITKAGGA